MTDLTPTDFRALCAELVGWLEKAPPPKSTLIHGALNASLDRARAALAQPEPQEPTNERLTWLWNHLQVSRRQLMALRGENCLDDTDYQQFARSVLKQWGRPKPPSLKEQALRRLDYVTAFNDDKDIIRRALESIHD